MEKTEQQKRSADLRWDDEKMSIIASAEVAAMYFGVTKQTLSNWVKDGCPRYRYGYYDIKDVAEYRLKRQGLVEDAQNTDDVSKMSLKNQKIYFEKRLKEAQSEVARMNADIKKGHYLLRDDAVEDMAKWAIVCKRSLTSAVRTITQDVASQVSPEAARRCDAQLTKIVNELLRQLATEGCYHEQ